MTVVDFFIGGSVLCYMGAAISLAFDKQYALAGAFVCWACANALLVLVSGGTP